MPIPEWVNKWIEKLDDPVEEPQEDSNNIDPIPLPPVTYDIGDTE